MNTAPPPTSIDTQKLTNTKTWLATGVIEAEGSESLGVVH